jgi:4-hydroxybenzoate polyprenyltransferase
MPLLRHASLLFVAVYPQFVLGLTFSWSAILGLPALGVDLIHNTTALTAARLSLRFEHCLYGSIRHDIRSYGH